tara:strand:+ start:1004 stop:2278 length:1275 start_codon:yes stop_codon:yes gene_type:complete
MKKINQILEEVSKKVKLSENDLKEIEISLKEFFKKLDKKIKSSKLDVEVFIGGSFAKKSMINKKMYDVDIYIRFHKRYENISELTKKLLSNFNATLIHGSRDYFRIKISSKIIFEIIPVIKIKKPEEAKNITDLSYFHVNYIKKKLKIKRITDEILIAKTFCHANQCYGAESYINGFSGYALELLIYHYGSFLKFIKAVSKIKDKDAKIVIDTEKHFKNKQEILMNLNNSKLQSPIIFIDPTYKQRNVLAALSHETFEKFKRTCKEFLKNPNMKFFEERKIDLEKIKKNAKLTGKELILIELKTNKQKGDIAGSKLLKFYNHLRNEISKYFEIKKLGFEYNDEKFAKCFFVVRRKKEILSKGPKTNDKKNLNRFKKKHKSSFVKSGRIYAKKKINFSVNDFIKAWKMKNKKLMKEMSMVELKII